MKAGPTSPLPDFVRFGWPCLALLARPALSPAPPWSSSAFFATPRLILLGGVLNRTDFAASTPTRALTFLLLGGDWKRCTRHEDYG